MNRCVGAALATALAVAALTTCERAAPVAPPRVPAVRAALTPLTADQAMGKFQVCSDGSAATYAFSAQNFPDVTTGQKTGSVTVAAGDCAVLYTTDVHGLSTVNAVTITMTNPTTPNMQLTSVVGHALFWHCDLNVNPVVCTTDDTPTTFTGSTSVTYNVNGDIGALADFNFTAPPALTLVKTADAASVAAGAAIGFTLTVSNAGPGVATAVTLTDPLPTGAGLAWSVSPANAACTIAAGVLSCTFGDLAAGGSASVHVTSPTTSLSCGTYGNTGTAQASNAPEVQASATTQVTCPQPTPCPAGSFSFQLQANGDLTIVYDQFPAPNDNSYGVNAVGWPRGHRFSDLYNSDHAGFQLVDPSGVVRLSFDVDYLTANAGAPSGYKSLGVTGGDGKMLVGTSDGIIATTSLDRNLNGVNIPGLFNAAHVQQFGSVNLLVDSPPTDPAHLTYIISDPTLAGWDFHDTYFVTITAAKLASLGFNPATWKVQPNLTELHNSPAKPCPSTTGTLSVTKYEVKDKQVKITILNSGSTDVFLTALTLQWPSVNGKLMQVKLDGDVVYSGPAIAGGTADLTTAQLVGDQNKRKINHNSSDVYTLVFEKNADPALSHYAGTVTIGGIDLTVLPH